MEYKAVRTEVVMRLLSFKTALLLALIPATAAFAADEQQQDDKSYLPPASYIAAPGTPAANSTQAAVEPRARHARVTPRRHEARHNPYWRQRQPVFFFPF
jgi:hypothetical protein